MIASGCLGLNIFNVFAEDKYVGHYLGIANDYSNTQALYGLYTYEEFYELYPVPKYTFDAVDGANLKVALGKGLLTHQELSYLIERYSEFFV